MTYQEIKNIFNDSVHDIASRINLYSVNPYKDFTRNRKLPPDLLISFLISEGSSGTKNELLDFFNGSADSPSSSAFFQQRAKLKPEALKAVFHRFTYAIDKLTVKNGYRILATDGSTVTFFSNPTLSPLKYFVDKGHSEKGFYSIHINALYDLNRHTYIDAELQPVHEKDEFKAFTQLVDYYLYAAQEKPVYTGDRGYCSYNNMAHVIEAGHYFLFRAKDIHSKGILKGFDYPNEDSFDIKVKVILVRTNSKRVNTPDGYRRFIEKNTSFDYLDYGSDATYEMSFRIVRFALDDGSYESLITNLPADEFPPEKLKEIYYSRWGIETSFRKLKYTIGLSNFHACRPEYVMQEIWARLTAYNITETMINQTVTECGQRKHKYKVNFTFAAHICRTFFRLTSKEDSTNVMSLLKRELVPVREDRKFNRLKTAHFRKPRYFIYRAS